MRIKMVSLAAACVMAQGAVALDLSQQSDQYDYLWADSDYNKGLDQSMDSVQRLGGAWMTGTRLLTQEVTNRWGNGVYKRAGLLFGQFAWVDSWAYHSHSLFVHEHAHLTADRLVGAGYGYGSAHESNGVKRFFEWGINNQGGGGEIWRNAKKTPTYSVVGSGIDVYDMYIETLAGGINAEQTIAANLGEQSRKHNFVHVADASTYLLAKFAMTRYDDDAMGDRKQLTNTFKTGTRYDRQKSLNGISGAARTEAKWKYNIDNGDLDDNEMIAFLLSASTYNYAHAAMDYVQNGTVRGERTYHTIMDTNILYPDTESYISSRGLSWRMSSGYVLSPTRQVPFSYEKVTKGDTSVDEYGIGWIENIGEKWSVDGRVFFGSGASARVQTTYQYKDNIQLFGELNRQNVKSMDSRRHLYVSKKAKSTKITVGASYKF